MPLPCDSTLHCQYVDLKSSGTAVLFIHGIIGTPRQFDFLIREIPDSFSVYNMLLSGHGGSVSAFSRTSMKNWEKEVKNALELLRKDHDTIYICGHSMGTLLAIDEVMRCESKIKGLFLLQVPLYVKLSPKMLKNIFTIIFGKVKKNTDAFHTEKAYGIDKDKRLWLYIPWLPRYLELFIKKRRVRKKLSKIKIPAIALQSKNDELVRKSSYKFLSSLKNVETHLLNNSGHFYYGSDEKYVKELFYKFIK